MSATTHDVQAAPTTPMTILERAYALQARGYDEIPWFRLLGHGWLDDESTRAAVAALRGAGLIVATDAPGYFRLA